MNDRASLFASAMLWTVLTTAWAFAAEPATQDAPAAKDKADGIRLSFVSADWQTVLQSLAEQSESTLVMDRVPSGRFSRNDYKRVTRTDAVRLLNAELEDDGFRILEKGPFLVVVSLNDVRSRYRRPVVTSRDSKPTSAEPQPLSVVEKRQQRFDEIVPQWQKQSETSKPGVIKQVGHEEAAANAEAERARLEVTTQQRPAAEVGRSIYQAFRSRAKFLDKGPEGLPAFEVYELTGDAAADNAAIRPVQFRISIDHLQDRLIIDAPARQGEALAKLVRQLDGNSEKDKNNVSIVSTTKPAALVSKQLKPVIGQLAMQETQLPAENATPPAASGNAPAEEPAKQPGGEDLPAIVGGLQTEVTVEALEDLGVLILRGNDKDVQAVMEVIKQIEKLSIGTAPEIHLRLLSHVHCESLSELINSIYEQLATVRGRVVQQTQAVMTIPVVKPNAILVLASSADMESILDLIDQLDQPVDPQSEFAVFSLRYAIASQMVDTLNNFYNEREGLGARLTAIADARTNSVIVQARPRDLEEITRLVRRLDRDQSGSVSQMRIFPLKQAVASELAEVINTAIQSVVNPATMTQGVGQIGTTGQSSQQLRDAKSTVLQFLMIDGDQSRSLRSGLLLDIRVSADARQNSLLVTAPEQSMAMMAELIRQLDQPSSMVAEIKVFTLANADATNTASLLTELLSEDSSTGELGIQVAGATDGGNGLIPLRFSVDARTNSVIAVGGAASLQVVEAILLRLDESDIRQRKNMVVKLKNSPADDVATAINDFLSSQRELEESESNLVSAFERIEKEVIVVPEAVSNSLLISASPRFFDEVYQLVLKLDEPPAQVIIQALLVEVVLQNNDEFGVELGFQDSVLFNRSVTLAEDLVTITKTISDPATGIQTTTQEVISQAATPGFFFNNQAFGNNIGSVDSHPAKVGTQALSSFSLGRVNNDLGFGGLVLSAGSESVSVLLRALAANRHIDILSRPQIRTLDNQEAQIQVGQQVPVVDGVNVTTAGAVNPVIRQDESGIILTVTPRISPDGQIVMEVVAEKSQFTGAGVPIYTDITTGSTIESPIKDITTARTTVSVRNNQTIVLGGMITKTDDVLERKVPWLGDIPVLGVPFRYDGRSSVRTELLIFLTPRIIESDEDSEVIKQIEAERIHFIEECAEQIHGPIYALPVEQPVIEQAPAPMPKLP